MAIIEQGVTLNYFIIKISVLNENKLKSTLTKVKSIYVLLTNFCHLPQVMQIQNYSQFKKVKKLMKSIKIHKFADQIRFIVIKPMLNSYNTNPNAQILKL